MHPTETTHSAAVHCACKGAQTGIVEAFCLACLDAYAEACQSNLHGPALEDEMARVAKILGDLLDADRPLLDASVAEMNRETRRRVAPRLVLPRGASPH